MAFEVELSFVCVEDRLDFDSSKIHRTVQRRHPPHLSAPGPAICVHFTGVASSARPAPSSWDKASQVSLCERGSGVGRERTGKGSTPTTVQVTPHYSGGLPLVEAPYTERSWVEPRVRE